MHMKLNVRSILDHVLNMYPLSHSVFLQSSVSSNLFRALSPWLVRSLASTACVGDLLNSISIKASYKLYITSGAED